MELPDNISVCSYCDKHSNDDYETVFDEYADPYHRKCLNKERNIMRTNINVHYIKTTKVIPVITHS